MVKKELEILKWEGEVFVVNVSKPNVLISYRAIEKDKEQKSAELLLRIFKIVLEG